MKEQPENWDKWSVERQIGYNLAIGKSDIAEDETFYKETWSGKIIGNILFFSIVVLMILTVVALFTIIGVQLASAIWGEYTVIYWLADLF